MAEQIWAVGLMAGSNCCNQGRLVSASRACRWIDCWIAAQVEDEDDAAADGDGEEFVAS